MAHNILCFWVFCCILYMAKGGVSWIRGIWATVLKSSMYGVWVCVCVCGWGETRGIRRIKGIWGTLDPT